MNKAAKPRKKTPKAKAKQTAKAKAAPKKKAPTKKTPASSSSSSSNEQAPEVDDPEAETSASEEAQKQVYWRALTAPFLAWRSRELEALGGQQPPDELTNAGLEPAAWKGQAAKWLKALGRPKEQVLAVKSLTQHKWRVNHRARRSARGIFQDLD
eukprot:s1703_g23.t1